MKKSFTKDIIDKYSKKIFGFSMSKTKNVFDAEDLSQEILMNLLDALNKNQEIYNLDGFIYKLCFYTWSNYVRKNIKFWRVEKDDFANYSDDQENDLTEDNKYLINEIRKRVAYLSGVNQKIVTMHYYDNVKLVDIAKILNINENTVRTNLRRTKLKLREKIIMNESLHYKPIQLSIGHNGKMGSYGNLTNLLGQNILYACYKNPKTIEEIAEEVQVASCYLKDYLDQFLFHDWMVLNNKKYQTNFLVYDNNYNFAITDYTMKNIKEIALPIYNLCEKHFNEFKLIVNQDNFSKESLMWFFTSYFSQYLWGKFLEKYIKENINTDFMLRKDGYNYALFAHLIEDVKFEDSEFEKHYNNINSMLTNKLYGNIFRGLTISEVNRYCDLESVMQGSNPYIYDAYELNLIYEIIKNNNTPNEKEKVIFTKYIKEEVIKIVDGKPKWNVIFLEKEEAKNFYKLINKMIIEFDETILKSYLENYKKTVKKYIPRYLEKEMIEYYSTDITITSSLLLYLEENNKLKMPKREECKASSEWFYVYN